MVDPSVILILCLFSEESSKMLSTASLNSRLTVSNQIVKSLSLCYEKSYFFGMAQPIDLIFCKMIEIIEQNFFNHVDFYLGPKFLFWQDQYFQLITSPILNP